jgi:glycosyltransferase involved in cell wall biosynthesis
MIILSILIPTIPQRANMFTELFNEVHRQIAYMDTVHPTLGRIEVLIDDSPKFLEGGLSIGKKREALLKRAEGQYLCYLDDDESIAPNYIETLVRLCAQGADVCTFRNLSKMDTYWMIVDMSLNYKTNDQATPSFIVRRSPWHINPVKSHLAKMYAFEDKSYGEDYSWFEQVLKHCTTEAHTDAVIHQYNHGKHSESDKITAHELLAK